MKIVTVDDDTYKYKYIIYEDARFYGVKDNPGEDVKILITVEVEEVMMKRGLPWWALTFIGKVLAIGILFIIASATYEGPYA